MTLEKRGKNRWRIVIMHNGERYRTTFEGNKTDAKKAHDEFKVQVDNGVCISKKLTLARFVPLYRESKYQSMAPKSISDYDKQLNDRIIPTLGRLTLNEIGLMHIKRFYKDLKDEGTGDRTIKKCHQILSSVFSEAVHLGYLNDNPCKKMPAPKYKRINNDNCLHADEAVTLLECLEAEPLHDAIVAYIALLSGARLGEICALTWKDVDLDKREININKSRQRVPQVGMVDKETKNEGSNRIIPTPNALEAKLRTLRRLQSESALKLGEDYQYSGYVATYADGRATAPSNRSRWFGKFVTRNGLRKITLHGLRHTYATLLLHGGNMPGFAISGNLGHSDPTMLMRTYAHEIEASNRIAADYMDELFAK